MELESFIEKFAEQFEETSVEEFTPSTKYQDLDEWNSLMTLSIIAMIDEEYNVRIKGEEIRDAKSLKDLFDIVKSRKNV